MYIHYFPNKYYSDFVYPISLCIFAAQIDIYYRIKKVIMNKLVLTESERKEIDLLLEEFNAKGGMSDEELMARLDAIPFEEFMNNLSRKIRNSR